MDLLEYAEDLVGRGNSSATHNSHLVYLQTLTPKKQPNEVKTEIQPKTEQNNPKSPNTNSYLLIGGLILLLGSVLALGY